MAGTRGSAIIVGVDDDPDVLSVMNVVLTRAGFTFVPSNSGEDCVRRLHHLQPDLVLLDVQLNGGIDGFETCKELREISTLRDTPIIFVTARKTNDDVRAGILAGGNDFVVKPFDRQRLLARVQHWLQHAARNPGAKVPKAV